MSGSPEETGYDPANAVMVVLADAREGRPALVMGTAKLTASEREA